MVYRLCANFPTPPECGIPSARYETAANGEVMYADEGPYTIDVRHVEKMVGTTREVADGDRVRRGQDGDETVDETGGPRDDRRQDGGDGW